MLSHTASPRRLFLALAAVALLGAVAACGEAATPPSQAGADPAAATGQAEQQAGPAAQNAILEGTSVPVPAEGKPTVAYFFAVGCASCAISLREIGATRPGAPEGTEYVAIDINPGDTDEWIHEFLDYAGNPDFTLLRDTDLALSQRHKATALGTTVVFDSSGAEVFRGVDPDPTKVTAALEGAS